MKNNIYLLDCTLRDGGYLNNWDFKFLWIKEIIKKLTYAQIDFVEVGFLQNIVYNSDKSIFNSIENIQNVLPKSKYNTLFSAMIALGKNNINIKDIQSFNNILDVIRITFHFDNKKETDTAFQYCDSLKKMGYKVCMQPVGSSLLTDRELVDLTARINQYKPYAFYLVDTLGTLTPKQATHKITIIDMYLLNEIKIGFHSHNNLQLSFSNSISLISETLKHDLILDCSLMGMGRGAGNLPTELIATYYNNSCENKYNLKFILKIIDEVINPLSHQFKWGYNMYYFMSALYNCHPDYATYLLNKQTLPINQVSDLLKNIPIKLRHTYNKDLIKNLYFDCQISTNKILNSYKKLKKDLKNNKILILGPGSSINFCQKKIANFVVKNKPTIISINTIIDKFGLDYLFVSNRKRYYELIFPIKFKTIFTSNLPNNYNPNYCVNYNDLIIKEDDGDNALIMAINLFKKIGFKKLYLAGFDGFKQGANNYFSGNKNIVDDKKTLDEKNKQISNLLNSISKNIELIFITPTKYCK